MSDAPARPPSLDRPIRDHEARAFELWLRADLARRYGPATLEPVPEDLLRLLPER